MTVAIAGGGPAGSSAAIAALRAGAAVRLFEKSPFPRHKVCGEFLSPEAAPLLERLGVALPASRIARVRLHIGRLRKSWRLDEPALGVSRYALDDALLRRALAGGAQLRREHAAAADIEACGRRWRVAGRPRLFGFKAHFDGACDDALDLFVAGRIYLGVCAVDGRCINVCGVAPEDVLRGCGFEPDGLIAGWTGGLRRTMNWLITGPLAFGAGGHPRASYPAGDALGFIDPFTGSGVLSALWTGMLAGQCAARGCPASEYREQCRRGIARQYRVAALFREVLSAGCGEWLAAFVPGKWLFRLTRPNVAA